MSFLFRKMCDLVFLTVSHRLLPREPEGGRRGITSRTQNLWTQSTTDSIHHAIHPAKVSGVIPTDQVFPFYGPQNVPTLPRASTAMPAKPVNSRDNGFALFLECTCLSPFFWAIFSPIFLCGIFPLRIFLAKMSKRYNPSLSHEEWDMASLGLMPSLMWNPELGVSYFFYWSHSVIHLCSSPPSQLFLSVLRFGYFFEKLHFFLQKAGLEICAKGNSDFRIDFFITIKLFSPPSLNSELQAKIFWAWDTISLRLLSFIFFFSARDLVVSDFQFFPIDDGKRWCTCLLLFSWFPYTVSSLMSATAPASLLLLYSRWSDGVWGAIDDFIIYSILKHNCSKVAAPPRSCDAHFF